MMSSANIYACSDISAQESHCSCQSLGLDNVLLYRERNIVPGLAINIDQLGVWEGSLVAQQEHDHCCGWLNASNSSHLHSAAPLRIHFPPVANGVNSLSSAR